MNYKTPKVKVATIPQASCSPHVALWRCEDLPTLKKGKAMANTTHACRPPRCKHDSLIGRLDLHCKCNTPAGTRGTVLDVVKDKAANAAKIPNKIVVIKSTCHNRTRKMDHACMVTARTGAASVGYLIGTVLRPTSSSPSTSLKS